MHAFLAKIITGFAQILHIRAGTASSVGHNRFVPQFFIH
jgi:hypothetical protein